METLDNNDISPDALIKIIIPLLLNPNVTIDDYVRSMVVSREGNSTLKLA
jgi:hypothetical protein